jgi:hypothetical protein
MEAAQRAHPTMREASHGGGPMKSAVMVFSVYAEPMKTIILSRHRTLQAAKTRMAKELAGQERRIRGGSIAAKGERYYVRDLD